MGFGWIREAARLQIGPHSGLSNVRNMGTKAVWDVDSTEIFINTCIEQICQKQRQGMSFTKIGWKNIASTFNEKTGKAYEKKQLKNRLDILRKDLKTWDALNKESGVDRDPTMNTVLASNEWWQQKSQENSSYKKFRHTGLKFEKELRIIFKEVMVSGDHIFAPPFTQPQTNEEGQDNVFRPTMDEEEGSRDSEEKRFGATRRVSTKVTDELASIRLSTITPPTVPTDLGSHDKRKRGEGAIRRKKQKISVLKQIADALSVIANASQKSAATLNKIKDVSIDTVMAELLDLEEVQCDEAFRVRCIKLLMNKSCRGTFVSLKNISVGQNKGYLIEWLRFMVDNP